MSTFLSYLLDREIGDGPAHLRDAVIANRTNTLTLSTEKEVVSCHGGPITRLDIDRSEGRYLLTSGTDAVIGLYDTVAGCGSDAVGKQGARLVFQPLGRLQKVKTSSENGHLFCVTSVGWYPSDTGMFYSSSMDKTVKVWDTNHLHAVATFPLDSRALCACMSPIAQRHSLIAVGTADSAIRLCDLRTATFSHSLIGHRGAIQALAWSTSDENCLASGCINGAVRVWDIRRSGARLVLDMYDKVYQKGHDREPVTKSNTVQSSKSKAEKQPRADGVSVASKHGDSCSVFERQISEFGSRRVGSQHSSASLSYSATLTSCPPAVRRNTRFRRARTSKLRQTEASERVIVREVRETAKAHTAAITAIAFASGGLRIVTSGADSKVRLWDSFSGMSTKVNYAKIISNDTKGIQIGVSRSGDTLFHPCRSEIQAYDVETGKSMYTLRGHYGDVSCVIGHPWDDEVYSGGMDSEVLVFTPKSSSDTFQPGLLDADAWSSSDS
eukprot:Rmarinus@m.21955